MKSIQELSELIIDKLGEIEYPENPSALYQNISVNSRKPAQAALKLIGLLALSPC